MRTSRAVLTLLALLAPAACTDRSPVAPDDAALRKSTVAEPATGPWARVVEGETGPGSLYAVYVPRSWNGDVVYYTHGIVPPSAPVVLPGAGTDGGIGTVRDALGTLGYAVAYSSYSENGLAIKDGAQRTHQLRGLVNSVLPSRPESNYLLGYSLGAAVSLSLVERFPTQYDGALLMCGLVGGTPLEVQYLGNVRALFDHYYPGTFPGDVVNVPEGTSYTQAQLIAMVGAAIQQRGPFGLFAIASTAQTPLPYAPIGSLADPTSLAFQSLVGSLVTALGAQLTLAPDVIDRTHGHSPFDNSDIVYTLGTPVGPVPAPVLAGLIAQSNVGVARYASTPDARNYLDRYYVPTGDLQIPVLTVHNLFDPLVPYFHEPALLAAVQQAGATDNLLQRAVPNYGHCNFPAPAVVQAFQQLVAWSNTGVRPAS